jgi:hypothetical protein
MTYFKHEGLVYLSMYTCMSDRHRQINGGSNDHDSEGGDIPIDPYYNSLSVTQIHTTL